MSQQGFVTMPEKRISYEHSCLNFSFFPFLLYVKFLTTPDDIHDLNFSTML